MKESVLMMMKMKPVMQKGRKFLPSSPAYLCDPALRGGEQSQGNPVHHGAQNIETTMDKNAESAKMSREALTTSVMRATM